MRVDLKPYKEYKHSGVEWIGRIPSHWEVRGLGHVGDIRISSVDKHSKEEEVPVLLCNYVDVYRNERITRGMPLMAATAKPAELARFLIREGDVLLTKDSEAWDDIGVAALVEDCDEDVVLGNHLGMVRPHQRIVNPRYLFQALQSKGVAYQFHARAKGVTRYGLSYGGMRSVVLPLPPLTEQASVARFLDSVNDKIRWLVKAKEKLVGLLDELRSSTIAEAVTGQIDVRTGKPYPSYKSCIDWLGHIPAHWETLPNRWIFDEIIERDHPNEELLSVTIAEGVVPQSTIRSEQSAKKSSASIDRTAYKLVLPGDIVYNKMRAWQGAAGVSWFRGIVSPAYVVQRLRPGRLAAYFHHLFRTAAFAKEAERWSYGIASDMWSLRPIHFKMIHCPLPPLEEQIAIAEYLDRFTAEIDNAIANNRREITLLQEYRTRMVADVVTGKVDVRDTAEVLEETAA